jgi:hypothetical protein
MMMIHIEHAMVVIICCSFIGGIAAGIFELVQESKAKRKEAQEEADN